MKMNRLAIYLLLAAFATVTAPATIADSDQKLSKRDQVVSHWTPARRAAAIPRDLVIDPRGLGYLKHPSGRLIPYGHTTKAEIMAQLPKGKPSGGSGDSTPPSITPLKPLEGDSIGTSGDFRAQITDDSGIKSVTFTIGYPSGMTQNFTPSFLGEDIWGMTLNGFSDGSWRWQVTAKDGGPKGGNSGSTGWINFAAGGTAPLPAAGDTVVDSPWGESDDGGAVKAAAGRIYFEMPTNSKRRRWAGYVCSGTVVNDGTSGRSIIITAAHCVYDDANKAFARNVLFIPNQDGTSGSGTDLNCSNDPIGCWTPNFGVVDSDWASRVFPDNIPWDYAYYVVSDSGAHDPGLKSASARLDEAVSGLTIDFSTPEINDGENGAGTADFTHALGYSYSYDPDFRYCAEDMTTEGSDNWWLPSCGLSGGSSGGPWIQPMDAASGNGPIISVNSWGYSNSPGMAGPKLSGLSSAECLFGSAKSSGWKLSVPDGDAGYTENCPY